ncbi:MAG: hypothetical protein QW756_06030 [Nitrososphaerota archaeon]
MVIVCVYCRLGRVKGDGYVERGSRIFTDEYKSYTVNDAKVEYVRRRYSCQQL